MTGRFWQIAVLTAAGAFGSASQAEAALYYWSDYDPGYSQPATAPPQRPQKARPRQAKKIVSAGKESAKPQGPLIIAISIEKQTLRVYDANGFFAESADLDRHEGPFDADGRLQHHPEAQAAPFQHL